MARAEKRTAGYAVFFGYRGEDDPDTVGFLLVTGRGYEIVRDASEATRFPYTRPRGKRGWADPGKWQKFFNSEAELRPWVFHPVRVVPRAVEP